MFSEDVSTKLTESRLFSKTASGILGSGMAELWTDLDDEELQEVAMVDGGMVEGADSSVEFAGGIVDIEGEFIGVSSPISSRFLSSSRRRRLRKVAVHRRWRFWRCSSHDFDEWKLHLK